MSTPLDGPMWRQGNGLKSFLCFLPVLVIRFCNIKAPCSPFIPPLPPLLFPHTLTSTGVVCLLLVRAGGFWRSVSGKLCPHHGVPAHAYCASHPCANPICSLSLAHTLLLPQASLESQTSKLEFVSPSSQFTLQSCLFPTALTLWVLGCNFLSLSLLSQERTPQGS